MRKHYLDNIRFLTIFFVVIFHVYFYYNNIGNLVFWHLAGSVDM